MTTTSSAAADTAAVAPGDHDTVVQTHGLTMAYGTTTVLSEVELRIARGELFALLGPNGAGKTTTVEILEGFRRRSAGEVRVLGQDPQSADERWRASIGMVLQSWADHSRWQVGELLAHFANYYEHPYDAGELMDLVGLQAVARRELRHLSGGQRRRVDVALGVVGHPALLFLDEPTVGFDPQARSAFHDLVATLRETGLTVLLTTHDLVEAERLADRAAILVGGQVIAHGSVDELSEMVSATSRVSWRDDGGLDRVRHTTTPEQLVYQLHQEFAGPIPGLQVVRPNLEQSYLGLLSPDGNGASR